MDLSLITGTAAAGGAVPRSLQGTRATDDTRSFLDALASMASLPAAIDGQPVADDAEASADGGVPSADVDASADGVSAFDLTVALPMMVDVRPVPASTSATGTAADDGGPGSTGSWPTPGGADTAAASALPSALPVAAGPGAAPVPPGAPAAGAQSPQFDNTNAALSGTAPIPAAYAAPVVATVDADSSSVASAEDQADSTGRFHHETPSSNSSVLDQLRASARLAERATTQASAAPAAVPVSANVIATEAPTSSSTGTTVATLFSQAAATAVQGQRPNADSSSGEQMPGFTFGGQTGPRVPSLAPTQATTSFSSIVNTLQTPDSLPAETSTQIVQAIRMQVLREGGEAHIRLDPRQFGDMTVRVRVDQGQVTARVEADTPVVREWLQSNQHLLRQSLAGQQLTLERLDVREPSSPSESGQRDDSPGRDQSRQREQGQPRQRRGDRGESFEVVA